MAARAFGSGLSLLAEREPLGPAGRSFDEVTGKDYLSQEERAWYLATLAQRQGPPPPTPPAPPVTPAAPPPAGLPPAPGPPAFERFQAEQGRALSLEGFKAGAGFAPGAVFPKPRVGGERVEDLPRRGPISAAAGDAANAALSFIGRQQPVGGGFGGPTVSEIGRAATVQPFREETGALGAAVGRGAGILSPSLNLVLDRLGSSPEKVGRFTGEELSPMPLDVLPVVGFGGDIARLGTAAARRAPAAARAVGQAPAAAGRGLVLGAKRGAPGITAAADIGLGPRLTPRGATVAGRKAGGTPRRMNLTQFGNERGISEPYIDELLSPSGKMSGRAWQASRDRFAKQQEAWAQVQRDFQAEISAGRIVDANRKYLPQPIPPSANATEALRLRRTAQNLQDLADRGTKPRAYRAQATKLRAEADALDGVPGATAAGEGVPPSPGGPPAAAPPISPPAPGRAAPEVDFEQLRRDLGEAARTGKPQGPPAPGERLGLRPSQADRIEGIAAKPAKTTLALYKKDPAFVQKGTLEAALRDQGALPEGYFTKAQLSRRLERTLAEADAAKQALAAEAKGSPARPRSAARVAEEIGSVDEALAAVSRGERPPPLTLEEALNQRPVGPIPATKAPRGVPRTERVRPLQKVLSEGGVAADQIPGLQNFVEERVGFIRTLRPLGEMNRLGQARRRAVATVAGALPDPRIDEINRFVDDFVNVAMEGRVRGLIEIDKSGQVLRSATRAEQEALRVNIRGLADAVLTEEMKGIYTDAAARGRVHAELMHQLDERLAKPQQWTRIYQAAVENVRNLALGVDVGIVGQQLNAAFRRGNTALAAGAISKLTRKIARQVGNPEFAHLYRANAGTMEQQLMARGLDLSPRSLDLAANTWIGEKALDRWQQLQFRTILGGARMLAAEGMLAQARLAHNLFGQIPGLGKVARAFDIERPEVARKLMEHANMITSGGRVAGGARRRAIERSVALAPTMSRAQFNEVLGLFDVSTAAGALNTANQLASYGLTLGAMYGLYKALGDEAVSDFSFDPLSYDFGRFTTASGRTVDVLPQASLLKMLRNLGNAATDPDADPARRRGLLASAGLRFGTGRLNIIPDKIASTLFGLGYYKEGDALDTAFPTGTDRLRFGAPQIPGLLPEGQAMPWSGRLGRLLQVAWTPQQIIGEVADAVAEHRQDPDLAQLAKTIAVESALAAFNIQEWDETGQGAQHRLAQQIYGERNLWELSAADLASVNKVLAEGNRELTNRDRMQPWWNARQDALARWQYDVGEQAPVVEGWPSEFTAWLATEAASVDRYAEIDDHLIAALREAYDMSRSDATKAASKFLNAETPGGASLNDYLRSYREYAVAVDPEIVLAWDLMFEAEEIDYDAPKWLREFVQEMSAK